MTKDGSRSKNGSIVFERAAKKFLESLKSSGKAKNTVQNYACDLKSFSQFLDSYCIEFNDSTPATMESYKNELQRQGLRTNSLRRKLNTAKSFLCFAAKLLDFPVEGIQKWIPPDKIEKLPRLPDRKIVKKIVQDQPDTEIGFRNRILAELLLETGMLVSEAVELRQKDCRFELFGATLHIPGKRERSIKISQDLSSDLKKLASTLPEANSFFYGYSRGGRNPDRLTPRAVELLFEELSVTHADELEGAHLHPRTMRHLFVIEQIYKGKTQSEIMDMIGLKTSYAFRIYEEHLKTFKKKEEQKSQTVLDRSY